MGRRYDEKLKLIRYELDMRMRDGCVIRVRNNQADKEAELRYITSM